MSILDQDIYDDGRVSYEEKLCEGIYTGSSERIMKGFKIFQKKYVYKSVALQLAIAVIAAFTQVMTIVSAGQDEDTSMCWVIIVICVLLGGYILIRPKNTFRKLEDSIKQLEGAEYKAEIYTNRIIISTLYDPYISEEAEKKAQEEEKAEGEENSGEELPPATIIHLDNEAVEIVESSDIYVVYVKRVNVFVIPKDAFKPYEVIEIKNRLSNLMGVRFREG